MHHARRAFLTRFAPGATAAGVTALTSPVALAQSTGNAPWQPRRHVEDDWLEQVPGVHRFIIDTTSPAGFDAALLFAGNYFTANQNGYGLKDADLALVLVARHDSTAFAYGDAMWAKYGAALTQRSGFTDPKTKQAPTVNVHRPRLDELLKRGVQLAVCQMATRFLAGVIARTSGTNADDAYKELVANLVINAHMVPAGIVALNRAQERGYTFAHAV